MAITAKPAANAAELLPHEVLRPICVAGDRREVGEVLLFTRSQAAELISAGKLRRIDAAQAAAIAARAPKKGGRGKKADAAQDSQTGADGDDTQSGGQGSGDDAGA